MILRSVERGEGGLPLVMLHGLFGRAANFGAVQQRLAATRRVLALDLRGHGGSPHARPVSYAEMAADVAETLAALDALPCALLGHSMGGKVAMTLALTRAEAVVALIVADIAPVTYPSHFGAFVVAMLAVPAASGRAEAEAALAGAIPNQAVRRFLLQNFRPGTGWTCDLPGIAAGLPGIEAWPVTEAVYRGPALFVAGGRSDYIRPQAHPAIEARFLHTRFATLPDAGHWLHAEDPDGFVRAVDEFLVAPMSGG